MSEILQLIVSVAKRNNYPMKYVCLLLILAGCSSTETKTGFEEAMQNWTGKPVRSLISRVGNPLTIYNMPNTGDGRNLKGYDWVNGYCQGRYDSNGLPVYTYLESKHCLVTVYVDKETGLIVGHHWDGDCYHKEIPQDSWQLVKEDSP